MSFWNAPAVLTGALEPPDAFGSRDLADVVIVDPIDGEIPSFGAGLIDDHRAKRPCRPGSLPSQASEGDFAV
jgi:hypothetical protein